MSMVAVRERPPMLQAPARHLGVTYSSATRSWRARTSGVER